MNRKLLTKNRLRLMSVALFVASAFGFPLAHTTPAHAANGWTEGTQKCYVSQWKNLSLSDGAVAYKACRDKYPGYQFTSMDITAQVQSYLYMNSLANCNVQRPDNFPISRGTRVAAGKVSNYDLFDGVGSILNRGVPSYTSTDISTFILKTNARSGELARNGHTDCDVENGVAQSSNNDWIRNALNLWKGWDPSDFMCSMYDMQRASGNKTCNDPSDASDYIYPSFREEGRQRTIDAIEKRVYGPYSPELNGEQNYVLYRDSFLIACGAKDHPIGEKHDIDTNHKSQAQGTNVVPIRMVNESTGDIGDFYYHWDDTNPDDLSQWMGTKLGGRVGDDMEEPSCAAIAEHIHSIDANHPASKASTDPDDYSLWVKFTKLDTTAPQVTARDCEGDTTANKDCVNESSYIDCDGGSFSWLFCPFIELASSAAQKMDSFIMNTLDVDVAPIFDHIDTPGTQSYGYYTAWNSFRIIAIAFIVIAGLIMVISQALGLELLDAYTVRKILPRLLIGIIGISLSWPLMRLVVSFFNTLGFDVRALIYAPFADFNAKYSITTGILSTLGTGAAIFIMGPASLTIILTILIAVFVGFLTLVIREIAIIMLIIAAPIGIACFILPNTQRVWRLWYENFLGLLMAFPLISAVIAVGHVFAVVALATDSSTGGTGAFIGHTFGLVSHFTMHGFWQSLAAANNDAGSPVAEGAALVGEYGPLFIIAKLISMTTGAISTLVGGAGGFLNGVKGGLSKARGNSARDRMNKLRAGELGNDFTRGAYDKLGINNLGRRANAGLQGRFGFGARGRQAMATDSAVQFEQALKNNPRLTKFAQGNDDGNAVLALSGGTRRGGERAARQLFTNADGEYDAARGRRAVEAAAAIGFNRNNAGAALIGLGQNKSRSVGAGRTDIIRDGIERLSGNNAQMTAEIAGNYAFASRQVGRADMGGMVAFATGDGRAQFAQQTEALAARYAAGGDLTPAIRQQAAADLSMMDGIGRTKVPDIVGGTGAGMQQAVDTSLRMLERGDVGQQQRAATRLLEFQQNLSGASEENAVIINRAMHQAGVSYAPEVDGSNPTIAEQLARRIGMDATELSRGARTYGQDVPLAARGAGPAPPPPPPEE